MVETALNDPDRLYIIKTLSVCHGPLGKSRMSIASFEPLVEPSDDGFVPDDGIGGLLDPVVLIGEVKQLAGDSTPLEGVEGG